MNHFPAPWSIWARLMSYVLIPYFPATAHDRSARPIRVPDRRSEVGGELLAARSLAQWRMSFRDAEGEHDAKLASSMAANGQSCCLLNVGIAIRNPSPFITINGWYRPSKMGGLLLLYPHQSLYVFF